MKRQDFSLRFEMTGRKNEMTAGGGGNHAFRPAGNVDKSRHYRDVPPLAP